MTSWIQGSSPGHEVNVVFARGMPLDVLTQGLRGLLREPLAYGGPELARNITGYRYAERVSDPDGVETVFLASTPACDCPHGQNYMVPHCTEHPFQFTHSRGGFEQTYFNFGARRESRRAGGVADLLVRELLDAGIVGRDTPEYDTDPGFNADGTHTVRIIADHFGLPSPPLGLTG